MIPWILIVITILPQRFKFLVASMQRSIQNYETNIFV